MDREEFLDRCHNLEKGFYKLAECVSAVVVHEKVKQSTGNDGIPYLDFVQPENEAECIDG